MKTRWKQQNHSLIQIWQKRGPFSIKLEHLSSFLTQKDTNNTNKAAENKQQQHNGAVNKEDVSASLFSSQQQKKKASGNL